MDSETYVKRVSQRPNESRVFLTRVLQFPTTGNDNTVSWNLPQTERLTMPLKKALEFIRDDFELSALRNQPISQLQLKADFHSAKNIPRSTFPAHFLLNCSN